MPRQVEISDEDGERIDTAFRAYLGATLCGVVLRNRGAMAEALDGSVRPTLATWERLTGRSDATYETALVGWLERPL